MADHRHAVSLALTAALVAAPALFSSAAATADGQKVSLAAPFASPTSPSETRPPRPHPGVVWIAGRWEWIDGRSVWVTGHFDRPNGGFHAWHHGYWRSAGGTPVDADWH